jgi:hypothetical protein
VHTRLVGNGAKTASALALGREGAEQVGGAGDADQPIPGLEIYR